MYSYLTSSNVYTPIILGCDNDEIQIFSQGQIKEDFIGINMT